MKEKKKPGRPSFKATPELKKQVETMAGMGMPFEQIAALIGCCDDTLKLHFENELVTGKGKANFQIAQSLYNKAKGGDTAALIFWAKTQMRWKETEKIELTGKDDGPVEISDAKARLLQGIVIKKDE